MWRNHFISIIRSLKKNSGYTTINISGLAIGFASALLITIYVAGELTYDRHFDDHERIYRLSAKTFAFSSIAHLDKLKAEMSEVEATVNMMPNPSATLRLKDGQSFVDKSVYYVGADYFNVFKQKLVYGNLEEALSDPDGLVLTESLARKLFGQENPIGKELTVSTQLSEDLYRVTAVLPDLPGNTHLKFSLLARAPKTLIDQVKDSYNYTTGYSYFKTKTKSNKGLLGKRVDDVFAQLNYERFGEGKPYEEFLESYNSGLWVLPIKEVHLKSDIQFEASEPGSEKYLYIFLGVAVFIIILAAINYVNLATAQASKKAKEIGVRTVLGSYKKQLVSRFLFESILVSLFSVLIGFGLAEVALQSLEMVGISEFKANVFQYPNLLMVMLLVAFVTGFFAGIYPAFYLTRFKPSSVLKGDFKAGSKNKVFRSSLVIFQIAVSLLLAVFSLFVSKQLHYSLEKDLGFQKENVIVVDNSKAQLGTQNENIEPLRNELMKNPSVSNVSFSHYSMINQLPISGMQERTPDSEYQQMQYKFADADFRATMGMKLLKGRDFSPELDREKDVMIINESLAKQIGGDVIGKHFNANFLGENVEIVGVVEDFHYQDFSRAIGPVAFFHRAYPSLISIRINGDAKEALKHIEAAYAGFSNDPFDYYFFDQKFNQLFEKEQRLGRIISLFTGLAIFVATLGLIGLISYKLDQRIKEIGIRKVLGASINQILSMLTTELLYLVGIALLISVPLSYYAVTSWMNDFAYHTSLGITPFLIVATSAIVLNLTIVVLRSLKTVSANPIKALRNE